MTDKQSQLDLLKDFVRELKEHSVKVDNERGVKDLDEASGAYKPIDQVMANQADLVDIKVELTPLAVIKG